MASKKLIAFVGLLFLLSLVTSSQSARNLLDEGSSDCDFVGPCHTKADCAAPCEAAGHSPTAVLCVPYGNTLTCCCIIA